MPLWIKIKCDKNTLGNSLEISNYLYETGNFAATDPNFSSRYIEQAITAQMIAPITNPQTPSTVCANDPNFGELWGLQNSQNPGIDINICNAWTISEGAGVKVAVFDSGIYLTNQDLAGNILPASYDTNTSSSPSQVYNIHGTNVAGVIGALKNNNYQVVGVAPKSKLYSISISFSASSGIEQTTRGINWAVENGADIINNSWYVNYAPSMLDDAISNALKFGRNGLGTVVLFAAGNSPKPQNPNSFGVFYPANSNDEIMVVGSIDNGGVRAFDSCYGEKLDVVAPGVNILLTSQNNTLQYRSGTSFATPYVAGICALILSVNPYLSVKQVTDIIEKTSKKLSNYAYSNTNGRPNGVWNNETGYGLVDAYEAVRLAQQMDSPTLDLYVKDSSDDFGVEPNVTTPYMWTSDNIWVRNTNDNGIEHQNPEFNNNGTPNFIRVRVTNKSRVASNGNEQLKLYWAKASTGLSYPNPWSGGIQHPITGAAMGNPVGILNIPVLQPGQETILTLPWVVPNPSNYGNDGDQWHFCLLTRIETSNDPMSFTETTNLNSNVKNNNNIAWKNITVVDLIPGIGPGGVVAIGNPFNIQKNYNLEFLSDDLETGKPIFQEAEVGLTMDDTLFAAWQLGGNIGQELSQTPNGKKKIVSGNNATLNNITFGANETGILRLDFNFLTSEATSKQKYRYHIIQKDAATGQIIGGETFVINKDQRALFEADAGAMQMVNANEALTINAVDIQEPATYNWYDSNGNLIYQGMNLQIPNAIAENYRLEVISSLEGFKDYADVEVRLKPSNIENIAPNPATNNIIVNYKLNAATSAYIMIIGNNNNGISNNYILEVSTSQHTINITSYPAGYYTVALIVNGEVADAKTLIKQ